jgi:hypothetical protein
MGASYIGWAPTERSRLTQGLAPERPAGYIPAPFMSNRSLWNVRRRHEWLTTPLKGKHLKARKRARIGLQDAIDRKAAPAAAAPAETPAAE